MDNRKHIISKILSRFRGWIQAAEALLTNPHLPNFFKEQLYTLTSIPSPSSFTAKVTDYLLSELSSLGYSPERSNKGNVFVTLGGSGSPLVLAAHVDTLGAMVRSIKENGRLRPTTIGGHQKMRSANPVDTEIKCKSGKFLYRKFCI